MCPGSDHEQRVQALYGQDAHHAAERTESGQLPDFGRRLLLTLAPRSRCRSRRRAGHRAQRGIDFLDRRIFEREQAHRHALEHIDVENIDEIQPAFDLVARAGQNQQIAQGIDAHEGLRGRHRTKDVGHFGRSDELQRHDHHPLPGGEGLDIDRRDPQSPEQFGATDVIQPLPVARERQAVCRQHRFEDRQNFIRRHRPLGMNRDFAANGLMHRVIELEQISENGMDKVGDGSLLKLERNCPPCGNIDRFRGRQIDHAVVAGKQGGLAARDGFSFRLFRFAPPFRCSRGRFHPSFGGYACRLGNRLFLHRAARGTSGKESSNAAEHDKTTAKKWLAG